MSSSDLCHVEYNITMARGSLGSVSSDGWRIMRRGRAATINVAPHYGTCGGDYGLHTDLSTIYISGETVGLESGV